MMAPARKQARARKHAPDAEAGTIQAAPRRRNRRYRDSCKGIAWPTRQLAVRRSGCEPPRNRAASEDGHEDAKSCAPACALIHRGSIPARLGVRAAHRPTAKRSADVLFPGGEGGLGAWVYNESTKWRGRGAGDDSVVVNLSMRRLCLICPHTGPDRDRPLCLKLSAALASQLVAAWRSRLPGVSECRYRDSKRPDEGPKSHTLPANTQINFLRKPLSGG